MRKLTLSGAVVLLAACQVGTSGRHYEPARGPAGATVTLDLGDKRKIVGELLAVEPTTLLVLQERQITRVPLLMIRGGSAPKVWFRGRRFTDLVRERLRLISRYPQGISPDLEARLLQAYGQTEVQSIT